MKLSPEECKLFFELMYSLHRYANQKLKTIPEIKDVKSYEDASVEQKIQIRDALFQNAHPVIDSFVDDNPDDFSSFELDLVKKWKYFQQETFYLERHLKKYSIFISNDDQVYGVCGLSDDLEDMIPKPHLPFMLRTVLLPFEGKIVYDGLVTSYRLFFGSGVKNRLKESYLAAKQNNRIIETLGPASPIEAPKTPQSPSKSWKKEVDALAKKAQTLKGGGGQPPLHTPTFSLVKATLQFAQAVVSNPDDIDQQYEAFKKVNTALKKTHTVLMRQD